MNTIKEKTKQIIDNMPDDSSYTDILKALIFDKMIKKGVEDSNNGRIITNQKMQKIINQW